MFGGLDRLHIGKEVLFRLDQMRDSGQYFRPGRTKLELEMEVLNEHRREKDPTRRNIAGK